MPAIVAPLAGVLAGRIGGRPLLVAGMVALAAGLAWIAAVTTPTVAYPLLVPGFILAGVGMGLFFAPIANVVLSSVDPIEEGQASGATNTIREIGGVFGVAVLASVFSSNGSYASPTTFVDGLVPAVWVGAAIVAVGAVVALALPGRARREVLRRRPPSRDGASGRPRPASARGRPRLTARRPSASRRPGTDDPSPGLRTPPGRRHGAERRPARSLTPPDRVVSSEPMTTRTEPSVAARDPAGHDAPRPRPSGRAAAAARAPPSSPAPPSTPTTSSSRAPGTGRRSARPTRTRPSMPSTSIRPSTGRRSWSSPRPTSPARTSSARSRPTSRSSSRSAARSSTTPSRSRSSPRPTARPCARRRRARGPAHDEARARLRPGGARPTPSRAITSRPGDVEAALAAADVVLEGEYRVGHQEQLYIENNAMIAVPTEGGGVTVTGSLQCPYYLHTALKRGLGLDDDGGPRGPGGDRRRVRWQGGVPVASSGSTRRSWRARPSGRSA